MGRRPRRAARRHRGLLTLFDAIRPPDAVARIRSTAVAPLAAFIAAQLYFTIYPLLTRVPPALFWTIVAIVFAGACAGLVGATRVVLRHRTDFGAREYAWLLASLAATALCAYLFVSLTFPWL